MDYIIASLIPLIIGFILFYGFYKKQKVFECFVEGVTDGLKICLRIFPYLLAMIFAVSVLRASKSLDYFTMLLKPVGRIIGLPPELFPLILIKPLSGSGALGIYADIINKYGADTYIGRLASTIMGSTETIFYTLSVYFGAISIKKIRHTLIAAILADITAIIAAITVVRIIFNY